MAILGKAYEMSCGATRNNSRRTQKLEEQIGNISWNHWQQIGTTQGIWWECTKIQKKLKLHNTISFIPQKKHIF